LDGKLYRFHPITGKNAEDMTGESDDHKQELARLIREFGCKFYWQMQDDTKEYCRVEYKNIAFVLLAIGVKIECIEQQKTVLHGM